MDFRKVRPIIYYLIIVFTFSQCTILEDIRQLSKFQKNYYQPETELYGGKLEHLKSYPVVHLYGSPEEMGKQYGSILKPQLNALFDLFESVFSQKEMDDYLTLAEKTEPSLPNEIKSELKAISLASGLDYKMLVAMNVATKVDCSTLAVWGDATKSNELIMGRNAEYETKGLNKVLGLIVVRHPDVGLATVNVTYVGLIGSFSGMNENGICFGNMLSYNGKSPEINTNGMPIQMVLRIAGEKSETLDEYINFLLSKEYMIPYIVMAADKNKAVITENAQFKSVPREGQNGILASTNFFHTDYLSKEYEPDDRYSIIMNEVNAGYGNINVETVKSIMHKARKKKRNVQCVVFEPGKRRLHVCINKIPASAGPFKTFDIDQLLNNSD
ncbi:MAG: hypothetical protein JXR31_09775 [Prolixibacteraceae bacterium]|nr:hypothetical protein [Prolixibacteraceae bacterium]